MSLTFEEWIERVDNHVGALAGVSVHDLPDMDYVSMFEDETPAIKAARRALRNAQE